MELSMEGFFYRPDPEADHIASAHIGWMTLIGDTLPDATAWPELGSSQQQLLCTIGENQESLMDSCPLCHTITPVIPILHMKNLRYIMSKVT